MIRALNVEVRRCLARRLTWALIGLAMVASVAAGVVVFINAEDPDDARAAALAQREAVIASCADSVLRRGPFTPVPVGPDGPLVRPGQALDRAAAEADCRRFVQAPDDDGLRLVELWHPDEGDSFLLVTFVFLGIGALIGASSMVGAEWKAGTFTTLLTWEPRRVRVAVAKLAAIGLLGVAAAVVLQALFTAALLPAILIRGSTEGADGAWARTLLGGVGRGAALTGIGAVTGAAVAMIGRSTSATLGVAFAYLAIGEAIVRSWKPKMARWLLGENSAIFLTGRELDGAPFHRPVGLAAVWLVVVTLALAAVATATFRARDITT
ncbi:MAG: hypothetical protein ACRD0N_03035 [Acidimicrobiales bacterium]